MPKPNDKIGPYTLVSKLGRGAFGVVWLAEKRGLITTKFALKMPNEEDVDLAAVEKEAAVWLHAGGHPNVLPIIEADIYDEQVVIVSEYAPDGSLSKWLAKNGGQAPSIEAAGEMTLGILAGLEHLHERGIIHRDLKPDNILLQKDTPRLADFGIARILKTTAKSSIATGTPAYMPPEAFEGRRSEQTDIWSVGVIFYQLLTGRLPFQQADIPSLLMAIVSKEPERLPVFIPEPIQKVIKRALQKDSAGRFESASEMRKSLRNAIQAGTSSGSSEAETAIFTHRVDLPPTLPGPASTPNVQERDNVPVPPTVTAEVSGQENLTESQKLHLDYWTDFGESLKRGNSFIEQKKPSLLHSINFFPFGRSGIRLTAHAHERDKWIGVGLVLYGSDAKPHFHFLHQQKEGIEKEIEAPLKWDERPRGKESYIFLKLNNTDPNNRQDWPAQHEWLQEKLETFYRVFAPRIENLNVSDDVPENEQATEPQQVSPVISAATIEEASVPSPAPPTGDSPPASTLFAQPARKPNRLIWILGTAILVIGLTMVAFFTLVFNSFNSSEIEKLSPAEAERRGIAATVNGKPIMLSEVDQLVSQQSQDQQTKLSSTQLATARLQVLDSLIQKEVLFQRAEKEKLLPTEEEITQFINSQMQQANMTQEQFQKRLKEQNQTLEALRDEARKQIAIQKLQDKSNSKVSIPSDKEVEDFYNANKQQFVSQRGVGLAEITVDPMPNEGMQDDAKSAVEAKHKIDQIYQQLKRGEDFATVARTRSEDNYGSRGGDIGFATEEDLERNGFPQELVNQFFGTMQIGSYTVPMLFRAQWYIFKLTSRKLQAENLTLDSPDVRSQIKEALFKERQNLSNEALLKSETNNAKIVNYLASKT